jgi:hypothetical protein
MMKIFTKKSIENIKLEFHQAFMPAAYFCALHTRLFEFKPFWFVGKHGRLSMIFSSTRMGGSMEGGGMNLESRIEEPGSVC